MVRCGLLLTPFVLAAFVLAGCTKTSTRYCERHPDDVANCPGPDGGARCTGNADCAATADPVCNLGSNTCVQCISPDQVDACTDATPVCGGDQRCHACTSDDECSGHACLPTGACGTDDTVAYVSMDGTGSTCSMADPCDTLADALNLAPVRPFIKIAGFIDENVTIDGENVTLLGGPGARLGKSSGTVLTIAGTSNVIAYDLRIGPLPGSGSVGVEVAAGATGSIALHRVTVNGNAAGGVRVNGGRLEITQSRIEDNAGGGIVVRAAAVSFDIRNNFILFNGSDSGTSSVYGGVLIEATSQPGRFEYNTIAYNEADLGTLGAGVVCAGSANSATGNLVYGNKEGISGASTEATQYRGSCTWGNTFKAASGEMGFANPTGSPGDFHLTTSSPATVLDVAGDCSAIVANDFDGHTRPANNACDLGADELVP